MSGHQSLHSHHSQLSHHSTELVVSQTKELKMQEENANYSLSWFEQYWNRKRRDYFGEINDDNTVLSPEKLRQIADMLEEDIKTFWRFRAHNTLRLM